MTAERDVPPRDYGGWRRRRGIGLWGLDVAGTLAVLAVGIVLILIAAADASALMYTLPPVVVVGVIALARVRGESLAVLAVRRARWEYASARGYTRYRADVVTGHPDGFVLPGVLASLALLSAEDGYGGRYGLVWDRRTGMLTATLRLVPVTAWLADRADADAWVAGWGGWLASLGNIPTVRWVTVTVDTAPEPGSALTDALADAIDPAAPSAARLILGQLCDSAPTAAADVDTRLSVTFDPKAAPSSPASLTEAVAETGRTLIGLESALGLCGVTVAGRLSLGDIAGVVRAAFDPAARGEVARLAGQRARAGAEHEMLGWTEAGPVGAEEFPDHYRHDGGFSVAWSWYEAPRQTVTSSVLTRLLSAGPYPKRVSLQYRPFPASAATRVLEAEVNAAAFRHRYRTRTGRDETARDAYDQARARQAALEEAAGAGVCLFSLFVTVTVTRLEDLPRAAAWVEAAADSSKIRLRRMTYSQAAGFAATLPCGICPADLARRIPH